jgi:hypothetical protein
MNIWFDRAGNIFVPNTYSQIVQHLTHYHIPIVDGFICY